jgi:hypothetical protein
VAGAGSRLAALALVLASAGCRTRAADPPAPARPPAVDRLAALRAWENTTRARTDFARAPTSATALGPDPYRLKALRPAAFAGLLRGRNAIVQLDAGLHEVARLDAPESPSGLAESNGQVLAVGELSSDVARYAWTGTRLEPRAPVHLEGVRAMRDIAAGPEGTLYVVEEHDGRLVTFRAGEGRDPIDRVDTPLCHGPFRGLRAGCALLVDCLLDHVVVIRPVDARGYPRADGEVRIVHDGPMWGMDALPDGEGLLVAVGGVEDHPLDRTQGSFGFIDSFVTLYRVAGGSAAKLSEVNTSEAGVVTPKALHLARTASGVELAAAAYGSDRLARFRWSRGYDAPVVETRPLPPGTAAMEALPDGTFACANPLLDAWVRTGDENAVEPVEDGADARSADSRLGEALFFTTLMAPWDRSDGRLSRFTCETCHFEGYVDGRTHFTGRGDVHATTKPLLGLFNNRPHFSRALDPDLTAMVDNEFRVAGAKSDHDPWFSLTAGDFAWVERVARLPPGRGAFSPEDLRRGLMAFLMDFSPRPNPGIAGRAAFTETERAGAAIFRDRCESCHEARTVTDDPSTRVPFEGWERLVLSRQGPIVWAHADYEKTGVVPYVNEKGARVVSLRRLYKKYPYFTNGSARDLGAVLDGAAYAGGLFFHDGAPEGATRLPAYERAPLLAFLDLL